jgi:hypothetical protein
MLWVAEPVYGAHDPSRLTVSTHLTVRRKTAKTADAAATAETATVL